VRMGRELLDKPLLPLPRPRLCGSRGALRAACVRALGPGEQWGDFVVKMLRESREHLALDAFARRLDVSLRTIGQEALSANNSRRCLEVLGLR